jgi:hypothetical protein
MDTYTDLLYLSNNRPLKVPQKISQSYKKDDFKFYKKRMLQSLKDLFSGNDNESISKEMKDAYELYVKESIKFFKLKDKYDILQEDYDGVRNQKTKTMPCDPSFDIVYNDTQMMANINFDKDAHFNRNKLTKNFVKVITPDKPQIQYPETKSINLNDPQLKTKGVQKKNHRMLIQHKKQSEEEKTLLPMIEKKGASQQPSPSLPEKKTLIEGSSKQENKKKDKKQKKQKKHKKKTNTKIV